MLGDCPANLGSSLGGGEPGGACPAGEQSCGFLCLCPFCRAAAPRAWKPKLFLQQLLFCLAQGQLVGSPQLRFPVAVSQVGRPRCCLGWWSTVSAELTLACSKGGGIVLKPGSLNSPESSPQGLSLLLGRVEQHGSCSSISAFVQRSSWPNISLAFWVLRAFSLPTPHLLSLQTPACPYLAAHARFGQPYPGRSLLSAGTLCWHVVRHQIPVLRGARYSCSLLLPRCIQVTQR